MTVTPAQRAAIVDRALGIQIDLTTGNWSSLPTLIAQLRYIGADIVRVNAPTPGNWVTAYGYLDQLAAAGLKLDIVVDTGTTPAVNAAAIAAFVAAHPGSVAFVEGPNEPP